MPEEEWFDKIQYTWINHLIEEGYREVATLVVDAKISWLQENYDPWGFLVDLPNSAYAIVRNDPQIQEIIRDTIIDTITGYIKNQNGEPLDADHLKKSWDISFRRKLLDVSDNWRGVVKELIIRSKDPNQGNISKAAFIRRGRSMLSYNEMKFASQSEIRIDQEFEKRKILFFPLPLGVRAETGDLYRDHREVDFLICVDCTWGILEVSYHPDRFEKDAEKDAWFKKSGILCVHHYSAERCYNTSSEVVDEFLVILKKHRRY